MFYNVVHATCKLQYLLINHFFFYNKLFTYLDNAWNINIITPIIVNNPLQMVPCGHFIFILFH